MINYQLDFSFDVEQTPVFPSTRYQGSKAKFIDWIWSIVGALPFESVLDAFGGTGVFAYRCKQQGKRTTYNDVLPFNAMIGKALIENQTVRLSEREIDFLLEHEEPNYPHFIATTFQDIYYTDEENLWLDKMLSNIKLLENEYKRALAYFALFQACICKRPYNLFHRKNLYVRLSDVKRTFGNKATWDAAFEKHFRAFAREANRAIFDNHKCCKSLCMDAATVSEPFDLVYIDTPYIGQNGTGVDYAAFYHFLNGMLNYDHWGDGIDWKTKHRKLITPKSVWTDKGEIYAAFKRLFKQYQASTLVLSYRSDGIPDVDSLQQALHETHREVAVYQSAAIQYTLSKRASHEVLFVAKP